MNAAPRPSSLLAGLLRHAVLLTGAAFMLAPFVWMVATSLKPASEIFLDHIRLWPHELYAVENYTAAVTRAPLLRFMINGVLVTAAIFALQVVVALPCAYALAKLRFRGRQTIFAAILFCLLIRPMRFRCRCSCCSISLASWTAMPP